MIIYFYLFYFELCTYLVALIMHGVDTSILEDEKTFFVMAVEFELCKMAHLLLYMQAASTINAI